MLKWEIWQPFWKLSRNCLAELALNPPFMDAQMGTVLVMVHGIREASRRYAKKTRLYCQNCQALITVFVYYVSQHFMTLLFFPACTSRILSCLSLLWPSMTMSTKLISLDLLDDQVLGVERWDAAQIYPKPIYTLMDSWHQVFEVWGSSI